MNWLLSLFAGPALTNLFGLANTFLAGKSNVELAELQAHTQVMQAAYGFATTRMGQFILAGFAFPIIFYINKIVIWDICFGLGTTDPIRGQVAVWVGMIIAFVLGHGLVNTYSRR